MTSGMTPEDQKAYADIICEAYTDNEIRTLEDTVEREVFRLEVNKAKRVLEGVADRLAVHLDLEAVAAALALLADEYDELTDGNDEVDH